MSSLQPPPGFEEDSLIDDEESESGDEEGVDERTPGWDAWMRELVPAGKDERHRRPRFQLLEPRGGPEAATAPFDLAPLDAAAGAWLSGRLTERTAAARTGITLFLSRADDPWARLARRVMRAIASADEEASLPGALPLLARLDRWPTAFPAATTDQARLEGTLLFVATRLEQLAAAGRFPPDVSTRETARVLRAARGKRIDGMSSLSCRFLLPDGTCSALSYWMGWTPALKKAGVAFLRQDAAFALHARAFEAGKDHPSDLRDQFLPFRAVDKAACQDWVDGPGQKVRDQ